jgi:hypothetical protein
VLELCNLCWSLKDAGPVSILENEENEAPQVVIAGGYSVVYIRLQKVIR